MYTRSGLSALAEQGWSINPEKLQTLRPTESDDQPTISLQRLVLDTDLKKVHALWQACSCYTDLQALTW